MNEVEVTIKVIPFSKANDWSNWKELFLAQASRKDSEFGKCFDLSEEFPLEEIDKDGNKVPIKKNVETMRKAYFELLMSMNRSTSDGIVAFNIVKWSKDKDGKGDARMALQRLTRRYEPRTTLERGKLLAKFYSTKCGAREDPEEFIYSMENLRARINDMMVRMNLLMMIHSYTKF